jgi:hypothetical protein
MAANPPKIEIPLTASAESAKRQIFARINPLDPDDQTPSQKVYAGVNMCAGEKPASHSLNLQNLPLIPPGSLLFAPLP